MATELEGVGEGLELVLWSEEEEKVCWKITREKWISKRNTEPTELFGRGGGAGKKTKIKTHEKVLHCYDQSTGELATVEVGN